MRVGIAAQTCYIWLRHWWFSHAWLRRPALPRGLFNCMKARRVAFLILIALSVTGASHAVTVVGVDVRGGVAWIGNGYREYPDGTTVQGSDVSPLRPLLGAAVPLQFSPHAVFTPALDLFWQDYLAVEDGKVVPTQIETGSAAGDIAGTLGVILSLPVTYEWRTGERFTLGAGGGLALVLRLPLGPIDGSDASPLWNYFYSDLRFLYPEAQFALRYEASETIEVGGLLRVLWPVAPLITDYDVPFWDEMKIALMTTVRFRRRIR